jgi:hypothetical protein
MKNSSQNLKAESKTGWAYKKDYFKRNPEMKLLETSRRRARQNDIEWDLTRDDITIPPCCPVFETPFDFSSSGRGDNSPSLDRIDSTKGYTKDNIVVVSWRANNLKKDATIDELERLVDFYRGHVQNASYFE